MMMFSVIVLIGTGWSYLKPFLTDRDKTMMLVMLVVQFMFNIAALVLEETSPGAAGWLTWRDILHLLDMVCCCLILLPIMWSIRHLREAAEVDGKAARNMVRLKRFRTFYLLVSQSVQALAAHMRDRRHRPTHCFGCSETDLIGGVRVRVRVRMMGCSGVVHVVWCADCVMCCVLCVVCLRVVRWYRTCTSLA
jgi:hypothetical protein